MKSKESSLVITTDWVLRSLGFVVFSLSSFFLHQLNDSIGKLTEQIHVVEVHQIESDKRIQSIEVSREINMAGYQKIVQDVQDMKTQLTQMTARTQTIADFISKNVAPAK